MPQTKSYSVDLLSLIEDYNNQLQGIRTNYKSSFFVRHKYLLKYYEAAIKREVDDAQLAVSEAILEIEDLGYEDPLGKLQFLQKKIKILYWSGNINEANANINTALQLAKYMSLTWFKVMESKAIISLYGEDWEGFSKIIEKMTRADPDKTGKEAQDRLRLYKFYSGIKRFGPGAASVGRLINSLPRYTKDFKAMNASMVILDLLSNLVKGNESYVALRSRSVNRWLDRRGFKFERTKWFIKVLLIFAFADTDWARFGRNLRKYIGEMNSKQDSIEEIEIIPYNSVLRIIVDQRIKKSRRWKHYLENNIEICALLGLPELQSA